MNSRIAILCACSAALFVIAAAKSYTGSYCWRDFRGVIPSDGVRGGLDKSGRPIYIGQVLFEDKLVPGKIYVDDDKVYFEWYSKQRSTKQNVKILCAKEPDVFEWIRTNTSETTAPLRDILVKGGWEPGYFTYIGRAVADGETTVGKVICNDIGCLGLYTAFENTTRLHKVFEILAMNVALVDIRAGEING